MTIRQPNIDAPHLKKQVALNWHSMQCELITPMYGGGVQSAQVDLKMPIRVASIRGQLRFWWRLLATHKWKLGTLKDIQKAESELWGGMANGDNEGLASQIFLRVSDVTSVNKYDLVDYDSLNLQYALFPASNAPDKETQPHQLLQPDGVKWKLNFAFSSQLLQNQIKQNQVVETLQWWANFGGLGFRSRKGFGAVYVSHCESYPQICEILTLEQVEQAGCSLAKRNAVAHANTALKTSIEKLADFRQKSNIGRNVGQQANRPGRSRWPEPDALRRIQNTHADNHAPYHPAGNIFPRALFGLPIILELRGSKEPKKTEIKPENGARLASPLIFKPIYAGEKNGNKQWQATALVLPHEHVLKMNVDVNGRTYLIWNDTAAQTIKPLQEYSGKTPLLAFLEFFKK